MPFKHLSLALLIAGGLLAGITGFVMSQDTKKDGDLEDVRQGPRPVDPREYRIGQLIEDLAFTDTEGKSGKLSDYKDKKALVIAVTNSTCTFVSAEIGP